MLIAVFESNLFVLPMFDADRPGLKFPDFEGQQILWNDFWE